MPHSVLALDLAKEAGFAAWKEGDPIAQVYKDTLKLDDDNMGMRLAKLYKWALRVTRERGITDIVVEKPITGAGKEDKIIWLASAYGVITMLGAQCRINVSPIKNSPWFIFWCGTDRIEGERRKTYSVLEAQRRGFKDVTNHNIADALGVLTLRCRELQLKTPWDGERSPGPLFTGAGQPKGVQISKSNQRAAAILVNRLTSFKAGEG